MNIKACFLQYDYRGDGTKDCQGAVTPGEGGRHGKEGVYTTFLECSNIFFTALDSGQMEVCFIIIC